MCVFISSTNEAQQSHKDNIFWFSFILVYFSVLLLKIGGGICEKRLQVTPIKMP